MNILSGNVSPEQFKTTATSVGSEQMSSTLLDVSVNPWQSSDTEESVLPSDEDEDTSSFECQATHTEENTSSTEETSNSSSKTRGAAAPRTRITWVSLLGSEEPSLKLLRLGKLQRTNSSPISNCRHSKSAIFISRNINYNINSLLLLHVGTHIIYIYRALHTGSRNENNIGAATGNP